MKNQNFYKSNKKSQFLVFSTLFILLAIFYIYSEETTNPYIIDSGKIQLLENLKFETCKVAKLTNGTQLDSRFSSWETSTSSYCNSNPFSCTLSITKKGSAPSNQSLLNYTHYNYQISFESRGFSYSGSFAC